VVQANPRSTTFVAFAHALCDAGKAKDAEDVARAGLEQHPHLVTGRVVLGRALFEMARPKEAQEVWIAAAKSNPDHGDVFRWLGSLLLARGDAARARALLEYADVLAPGNAQVGELLARAGGRPQQPQVRPRTDFEHTRVGDARALADQMQGDVTTPPSDEQATTPGPVATWAPEGDRTVVAPPGLAEELDGAPTPPPQTAPVTMPPLARSAPPRAAPPAPLVPTPIAVSPPLSGGLAVASPGTGLTQSASPGRAAGWGGGAALTPPHDAGAPSGAGPKPAPSVPGDPGHPAAWPAPRQFGASVTAHRRGSPWVLVLAVAAIGIAGALLLRGSSRPPASSSHPPALHPAPGTAPVPGEATRPAASPSPGSEHAGASSAGSASMPSAPLPSNAGDRAAPPRAPGEPPAPKVESSDPAPPGRPGRTAAATSPPGSSPPVTQPAAGPTQKPARAAASRASPSKRKPPARRR
jgi:hypothetical protein